MFNWRVNPYVDEFEMRANVTGLQPNRKGLRWIKGEDGKFHGVVKSGGIDISEKGIDNSEKISKIKEVMKKVNMRGDPHVPPVKIDIGTLTYNAYHANDQRNHNVTERQAKEYIQNAELSITRILHDKRISENYYSLQGASYVFPQEKNISTSFSSNEYDDKVIELMKEFKKEENE